jgi:hypothetical protein
MLIFFASIKNCLYGGVMGVVDMVAAFRTEKSIYCAEALNGITKAVLRSNCKNAGRVVRNATSNPDLQRYNKMVKVLETWHTNLYAQEFVADKPRFKAYIQECTDLLGFNFESLECKEKLDCEVKRKTDLELSVKLLHAYTYMAMKENREVSKQEKDCITSAFKRSPAKILTKDISLLIHFSKIYLTPMKKQMDQEATKQASLSAEVKVVEPASSSISERALSYVYSFLSWGSKK